MVVTKYFKSFIPVPALIPLEEIPLIPHSSTGFFQTPSLPYPLHHHHLHHCLLCLRSAPALGWTWTIPDHMYSLKHKRTFITLHGELSVSFLQVFHNVLSSFPFLIFLRLDTLQTADFALKLILVLKLIFKMLLLFHLKELLLSAWLQIRGYQGQLSSEPRCPLVRERPFVLVLYINHRRGFCCFSFRCFLRNKQRFIQGP